MQHHEEIRHHHFYVEGGGMSCVNSSHVMTRSKEMAACEQDLAWLYERLQDLWDRTGSVDDAYEEISGYIVGMNSAQSQPVPEWQPIETAPTDGATFIAWSPAYKGIFVAAIHGANSWWSPGLGHMSMDHALFPTHWMPYTAPKPGGDKK